MTRDEEQAVRQRLQDLAEANAGRLTPQAVVQDAEDPESPLHSRFEWDNDKAAAEHRLEQARKLIRSVEVVFRNETTVVRAPYYVRDPSADHDEAGYVATKTLLTEVDLAREVVVQEFARAASVLRRAQNIAKALDMEGDIGALIEGIAALQQRVELSSMAAAH